MTTARFAIRFWQHIFISHSLIPRGITSLTFSCAATLRSFSEPRVAQFIFFFPDPTQLVVYATFYIKDKDWRQENKIPPAPKGGGPVDGKPGTCNSPFRGLGGFNYLRTELCTTYFAACCFAFRPNRSIISQ
jgi:hypothetical protein